MKMYFPNGNLSKGQIDAFMKTKAAAPIQNKFQISLNGSMIGRISGANKGCGSCGGSRH